MTGFNGAKAKNNTLGILSILKKQSLCHALKSTVEKLKNVMCVVAVSIILKHYARNNAEYTEGVFIGLIKYYHFDFL